MKLWRSSKFHHFQMWHLGVLLVFVIMFLIMLAYINSVSTNDLMSRMISIYRRDMAERVADQSAVALEVLLEHNLTDSTYAVTNRRPTIQALDIILSQQHVQRNVRQIYLLTPGKYDVEILENGEAIFDFFVNHTIPLPKADPARTEARNFFLAAWPTLRHDEQITSQVDQAGRYFHVLVPFYIRGELAGGVYMKIVPDVSGLLREVGTSLNESAALFSALVLLGLLVIFQVSSYMVRERDEAQRSSGQTP